MGKFLLFFFFFLLASLPANAEKYVHTEKAEIPTSTRLINFSMLYGVQWASYVITQHQTIRERGSFHNWRTNPFHPHFDFDGIDYNIFAHSYVGNLYYLSYRAHGYSEGAAFLWSIISSSAFEFSIETVTERPSVQDLYQTPVFGTLLGMGMERASLFFHSLEVWPARALGYLFNPFTVFPWAHYGFEAAPILNPQAPGVAVSWRF